LKTKKEHSVAFSIKGKDYILYHSSEDRSE